MSTNHFYSLVMYKHIVHYISHLYDSNPPSICKSFPISVDFTI